MTFKKNGLPDPPEIKKGSPFADRETCIFKHFRACSVEPAHENSSPTPLKNHKTTLLEALIIS